MKPAKMAYKNSIITMISLLFLNYCQLDAINRGGFFINNFQEGKTLNENVQELQFGISTNSLVIVNLPEPSENETEYFKNHSIVPEGDYNSFYISIGLKYALAKKIDLGFNGYFGNIIGCRIFFKYQLSNDSVKFNYSTLLGVGYSVGTHRDFSDWGNSYDVWDGIEVGINSNMVTFELDVPMSYQTSEKFKYLFGAKCYLFNWNMNAQANTVITDSSGNWSNSITMYKKESILMFAPAINFGFQAKKFCMEATIIYIGKKIEPSIGLGFNL